MFQERIASRIKAVLVAALVLGAAQLLPAAPVEAQTFRINKGCPAQDDPSLRSMTVSELNCRCFNSCESASTSSSNQAAADVNSVLNCGQHRALAIKALNDPSFVEGQASQGIVGSTCMNQPDSHVPAGITAGLNFASGAFPFERGYFKRFGGRKGRICGTGYSGTAYLNNGNIEFTSGGHTWRGRITPNSYISITREGVTPRPKNPTSITGPADNASLYNGYCGSGFFRLFLN